MKKAIVALARRPIMHRYGDGTTIGQQGRADAKVSKG
jgi:hypothetical protein